VTTCLVDRQCTSCLVIDLRSAEEENSQNKIAAFPVMSAGCSAREAVRRPPSAVGNFSPRSDSRRRCAGVRPFADPTDRRCGRGGDPSAPESLIGAAVAHLGVRDPIPRIPIVIQSEADSPRAFSEFDHEMRREQREKWRRVIDDEIPPSLRIKRMTGDSDATAREALRHLETIVQGYCLYRWLF
jgi:hypothetical protein